MNYVFKISFPLKFVNIVQGNGTSCWTQTQIANNGTFKLYIKKLLWNSRWGYRLTRGYRYNSLVLTSLPTDISSYRDMLELKIFNHQCFDLNFIHSLTAVKFCNSVIKAQFFLKCDMLQSLVKIIFFNFLETLSFQVFIHFGHLFHCIKSCYGKNVSLLIKYIFPGILPFI